MKKPKDLMALITPGLEAMWKSKLDEYSTGLTMQNLQQATQGMQYMQYHCEEQATNAFQHASWGMGMGATPNYNPPRHKVCFMRVNDKVEMYEGAVLQDALDGLRLKVKRWLRIPETECV